MKTYGLDFNVSSGRGGFAVNRPNTNRVVHTAEDDILTRSSRTIGDVAFVLLTITLVAAQPLWVMWFLVALYSR